MPYMRLEHYREKLLAKEKELLDGMAHAQEDALDSSLPEVQDEMDRVIESEQKAALLSRNSADYETLVLVRAALGRIDAGTYGKCEFCGKPIEEKRLNAIPWAAYDLQHQQERDRQEAKDSDAATL